MPDLKTKQYGKHLDGTDKGTGFFGELAKPNHDVSTELSIGVELDGKEILMPLLVPTLTNQELRDVLSGVPSKSAYRKAIEHGMIRLQQGRSPFADDQDSVTGVPGMRSGGPYSRIGR